MDLRGGWKPGLGGADCMTIAGEDTMLRGGAGRDGIGSERCGGATMTFLKFLFVTRSL